MNKKKTISRKDFIKKTATLAGVGILVPNVVLGSKWGHISPSDKLNIACVGIGGMGASNLGNLKDGNNIVALCDVDWDYSEHVFNDYPKAKRYKDFRVMFDEMGKSIDAVVVATADHTHAIVAANAMQMGKHVYVQKPLTHTVYESRLLTNLAKKHNVATQMGNQGASGEGVRKICDWVWNGEIGEITKVEVFTDRPIWPQGLATPEGVTAPKTLDWDLFIGPAKYRDYNPIYTPWNWRGWWDFGTGALGDMACHLIHPIFKALKLGYPSKVQGSSTMLLKDCAPHAQVVHFTFPARDNMAKVSLPEVKVIWYDGGLQPPRPNGFPEGKSLNNQGGGVIFHGTKDTLICGCYAAEPWLLSGRVPEVPTMSRVVTLSHEQDWARACKESATNRVPCNSDFSEAGPFNEMVVMGVLAVRLQNLNKELLWDGNQMQFTNISDSETIQIIEKDGFKIHNGHPSFDKKMTEPMNAKAFANELIKHTYRNGWSLPDMPKS